MKNFIHSNIDAILDALDNKKLYTLLMALAALFCCFNGSIVTTSSLQTSTEPDINFHGILEDHAHKAPIEFILIGGKYESIPVYQYMTSAKNLSKEDSQTQEIDPKQNKILINLQDVRSIALEHPNNPTASSIQVNGKTYIQIIIELLHGTKKKYLVESTRKITCKEIDKNIERQDTPTLQERDINFMHVKKLTIKGFKAHHSDQSPQIAPIDTKSSMIPKGIATQEPATKILQDKKDFKNNAAELLHAIEENVKNLPMDNPSAFETMRSTILTLLKSLRDQLQKFLDMIK